MESLLIQRIKHKLIVLTVLSFKRFFVLDWDWVYVAYKKWSVVQTLCHFLCIKFWKLDNTIWLKIKVLKTVSKIFMKFIIDACRRDINNKFSFNYCFVDHYSYNFALCAVFSFLISFYYINVTPKLKIKKTIFLINL